ncbi:MAG: rhodanese-like domain-containing protein [Candidatus Binataceae bacterium]
MPIKEQKPVEAFETLKQHPDAIYVDVRTEGEFSQGHAAGAINIPVVFIKGPGQMQLNPDFVEIAEKVLPKGKKLVVGCQAGGRSMRACEMLEDAGYTDLTNVTGGFGGQRDQTGAVVVAGWRDSNLPVSSELGDASYESQRKKAGL